MFRLSAVATFLLLTATLFLTGATPGCGGSDADPPGDRSRGTTACGDNECQPGQYCFDANSGMCVNGCTSDANCESGHVCEDISDVTGEGTCSESVSGEGEGEGEGPPPNGLQACRDACERFADCGMQGSDFNDCLNICPDLSPNQQATVAQCASGSCSDARNCLEIDCFNDSDCGGDTQCVGGSCL